MDSKATGPEKANAPAWAPRAGKRGPYPDERTAELATGFRRARKGGTAMINFAACQGAEAPFSTLNSRLTTARFASFAGGVAPRSRLKYSEKCRRIWERTPTSHGTVAKG